jgi:hypothetical protein
MLRYLLLALILIHGLIHLLGFVKAFQWAEISELTQPVTRGQGVFWLLATLLFLAAAGGWLLGFGGWSVLALAGVLCSQILIVTAWPDAKYGTIANVIILVVAVAAFGAWRFESRYRNDVRESLERVRSLPADPVTEADLAPLPPPVQRYLRYAGVVGQPRVRSMRVTFQGEMRNREQDWFAFTSEQYSFFDQPERFFFMRARVKGLPTVGYHVYQDGSAGMHIKILSLFPVVDLANDTMYRAETVTWFNDLCLFAPAALVDERITWEASDSLSAQARFTTADGVSIAATLHFNAEGELIDFVSDDRYDTSTQQQLRFSTPLAQYGTFAGRRLPGYGEAVWHYPEGKFAYGRFHTQTVRYNVDSLDPHP